MDVAEAGVGFVRHESNYQRTATRLAGYRVSFTSQAERNFADLMERVQSYLGGVGGYAATVIRREELIKQMETALYQEMKQGRLDSVARDLYIEIVRHDQNSVVGPFGWVFNGSILHTPIAWEDLRKRVFRRAVGADDLFNLLVAIRVCQRSLDAYGALDDRMSELLAKLPDEVLAVAGFNRHLKSMGEEMQQALAELRQLENAQLDKQIHRDYQAYAKGGDVYRAAQRECAAGKAAIAAAERRFSSLASVAQSQQPLGNAMSRTDRSALLRQLSKDAGLVEGSLHELLLDYPWPWPVPTAVPEEELFSLTSRPTP